MAKLRLVILSDIHGNKEDDWLKFYLEPLRTVFDCVYYDVLELANINEYNDLEEIHHEFLQGGIERAVLKLLELEKKKCLALGFSIGGTIAWKTALQGMPMVSLTSISSTRLRKEYRKPPCELELIFGENDMNRPMDEWFEAMEIYPTILSRKDHDLYREKSFIDPFCQQWLDQFLNDATF